MSGFAFWYVTIVLSLFTLSALLNAGAESTKDDGGNIARFIFYITMFGSCLYFVITSKA